MKRYESFELGCHKIKVKYVEKVIDEDEEGSEIFGNQNPKTNEVLVALTLNGEETDEDVRDHTFHHELVHCILGLMNHPLNEDEQFVDMFGMFLSQFNKTLKVAGGNDGR